MQTKFSKNIGPTSSGLETCENAELTIWSQWNLFAEDFPVSLIASPASEWRVQMNGIYGQSSPELFASLDRGLWLRKTCLGYSQVNLDGSLEEFSGTWPQGKHWVQTLEGPLVASMGDWIITGVKNEKYPCKPDIFEMTYEAVE